nr:ATP-dependent DNA helicase PIF1-like [Tanacetum cinerariifolium]
MTSCELVDEKFYSHHYNQRKPFWLTNAYRNDQNITFRETFAIKDSKDVRLFRDDNQQKPKTISGKLLGDGKLREASDGEVNFDIPDEMLIKDPSDPVGLNIDFTYSNMLHNLNDKHYLTEKSMLAPMNEGVNIINDKMLTVNPGEQVMYHSCDSVCK